MVIDAVAVTDVGTHPIEEAPEVTASLQRIDHFRDPGQLLRQRVGSAELHLRDEEARPRGRQVARMLHREGDHLPAGLTEQVLVVEEDRFGAVSTVVIVVDGEQGEHARWIPSR